MEESEIRETTVSDSGVRRVDPPVTSTRVTELRPASNYRAEQVIWFVVGVVDALLIIRFLLKLLGASLASGFVRFMYDLTAVMVAPFHVIFSPVGPGGRNSRPSERRAADCVRSDAACAAAALT